MNTDHRDSTLWKAAFCSGGLTQAQERARTRLLDTLDNLENHVQHILQQIPRDCHWLTIHDVSHCHQLWHVASTICGSEYILNPLEGFVLGGAFLIHDAGLTAGAYEGGVKALEDTVSYKEKLSIEVNRDLGVDAPARQSIEEATEIQKSRALFALLRELHAHRAQELLNQQYHHPVLKLSWTLVPLDLLLDVGEIIGKIAASHHWDISRVDREFREPATPPASFPEWTIDALKLGCILRCADACAIDERRSPVMAFVLEEPLGESRDHWLFQAHLKPAYLRPGDDALVFESKRPFRRDSMASWWLAYDGINLADRELRDSDRLLKRRECQGGRENIVLAAKRVEGAGNPAILKDYVTVEGWTPVETKVRISDPSALVELFGGKHLYGNDFTAPLRELIQNAADAVRVRRLEQGYGASKNEKRGQINISILKRGSRWIVRLTDDGIGMPADVMTGELLDFGKSLWRSDRLTILHPGLISNPQFNPTGRFGIGFYASFMLGKNIKVMSKPYHAGLGDRKILSFTNIRGRAEFRAYDISIDGDWDYAVSTIIEVEVDDAAWLSRVAGLSFHGPMERPIMETEPRFWDLVSLTLKRLVFSLEVPVFVTTPFATNVALNKTDIFELPGSEFAREFNAVFSENGTRCVIPEELHALVDYIGNIEDKSRGTVSNSDFITGIYHIGGLTVFDANGGGIVGARSVTGVHAATPVTVSRQSPSRAVRSSALLEWAERQKMAPR